MEKDNQKKNPIKLVFVFLVSAIVTYALLSYLSG